MIQEDNNGETNQEVKHDFRRIRRGPLDAYIYQKRSDEEDVKEVQQDVFVHLPEEIKETIVEPIQKKTHIFTDGACTNNGKRTANAAWGLIVVADQGYKVLYTDSGPIPKGQPQTNQRAELQALLNGLKQAKRFYDIYPGLITLWSDSQYSINCASVWGPKWRSNGWKKQGGDIQHLDIIKELVTETMSMGHKIQYKWLKGHKEGGSQYQFPWMFNHQVDALATAALA
jgi:ribonuclease HI